MSYHRTVFFSALVLFLLMPAEATAQARSDRYVISVYQDQGTCRYQIQDHADQDIFNITPTGKLTVEARGDLWIDVTVQDDPRGTPGTRSQRSVAVRQENGRGILTARSAIGRSTEHKVEIECCPARGSQDECPKWVEALPAQTSMGALPLLQPEGMPSHGPSAAELVDPPQPPGGPVMRVDED